MKKISYNSDIAHTLLSDYNNPLWLSIDDEFKSRLDDYLDDTTSDEIISKLSTTSNDSIEVRKIIEKQEECLFEKNQKMISFDLDEIDTEYKLSDLDNALYLKEYLNKMLFKCAQEDTIYAYNINKGIYETSKDSITSLVQQVVLQLKAKVKALMLHQRKTGVEEKEVFKALDSRITVLSDSAKQSKAIGQLKALLDAERVSIDELNNKKDQLVVRNGIVDMSNGTLLPFSKNGNNTLQADVEYDAEAECPHFEQFINDIMCNDQEMSRWLQMWLGYSFSGETSEQIYLVGQGSGANGKGTLVRVLQKLAGTYANVLSQNAISQEKTTEASPELIRLAGGKRLAIVQELPRNYMPNESLIKSFTGEDRINARALHSNGFEFKPVFKMLCFTNFLPKINGDDAAIQRRTVLMPFNANFNGRVDTSIDEKLEKELPGILNWIIKGFKMWKVEAPIKQKLPQKMIEAKDEWMSSVNQFEQFIMNHYEIVISEKSTGLKVTDLLKHYNNFEVTEQLVSDQKYCLRKQAAVDKLKTMFNSNLEITNPKNIVTVRNLRLKQEVTRIDNIVNFDGSGTIILNQNEARLLDSSMKISRIEYIDLANKLKK